MYKNARVGFDLDGVFAWEGKALNACFSVAPSLGVLVRDSLVPVLYRPSPVGRCVIVTGRPNCDRKTTERWLARKGFSYDALHMCHTWAVDFAAPFKASFALNMDYFVESDATQARIIQDMCPSTVVLLPAAALDLGLLTR